VLTKWVKDRKKITLSQAINMLCRQPAELYSMFDRGLLAEGLKADINVIDFEALKLHTPHIDGIDATIKAGEVIYQNNVATGALPGKLVRGMQADPR
jgi:N-acyl-D-aspartate/D-glutamate deacylase